MHFVSAAAILLLAPLSAVAAPNYPPPSPPCTTTKTTTPCTTSTSTPCSTSTPAPPPYVQPTEAPYNPVTPPPYQPTTPSYPHNYDPKTMTVTYVPPPSPPKPSTKPEVHCVQQWYGTAPFCNGKCPSGWSVVRESKKADSCEETSAQKVVDQCNELSKHSCWFGSRKQLCEQCQTIQVPA